MADISLQTLPDQPQNSAINLTALPDQPMGSEVRNELYPGEDIFFKTNPSTTGMAAEDNKIILNPYSNLSKKEKQGVIINEAARLYMRKNNIVPKFKVTPKQIQYFKGTPYENNLDAIKQTIVGRVLSGDKSITPTPEQWKFAHNLYKIKPKQSTNLRIDLFKLPDQPKKLGLISKGINDLYAGGLNFVKHFNSLIGLGATDVTRKYFIENPAKTIEYINKQNASNSWVGRQTHAFVKGLGGLALEIPTDILIGGALKVATAGTALAEYLSGVSNFVLGAGTKGAVEGYEKGGITGAVTKGVESATLARLYTGKPLGQMTQAAIEKKMGEGLIKAATRQLGKFSAIGVGQTYYNAGKQGRLPTSEEVQASLTQSVAMSLAFTVIPVLEKITTVPRDRIELSKLDKKLNKAFKDKDMDKAEEVVTEFYENPKISLDTKERLKDAMKPRPSIFPGLTPEQRTEALIGTGTEETPIEKKSPETPNILTRLTPEQRKLSLISTGTKESPTSRTVQKKTEPIEPNQYIGQKGPRPSIFPALTPEQRVEAVIGMGAEETGKKPLKPEPVKSPAQAESIKAVSKQKTKIIAEDTIGGKRYQFRIARIHDKDAPQLTHQVQMKPAGSDQRWESALVGKSTSREAAMRHFAERYARIGENIEDVKVVDPKLQKYIDKEISAQKAREAERIKEEKAKKEQQVSGIAKYERRQNFIKDIQQSKIRGKRQLIHTLLETGEKVSKQGTAYGDYAVIKDKDAYVVTHIPSGRAVGQGLDRLKDARNMAKALSKYIKLPEDVKNTPKEMIQRMKDIWNVFVHEADVPDFIKQPQKEKKAIKKGQPSFIDKSVRDNKQRASLHGNIIRIENYLGRHKVGQFDISMEEWRKTEKGPSANQKYNKRLLVEQKHKKAFPGNLEDGILTPVGDRIVDSEVRAIDKVYSEVKSKKPTTTRYSATESKPEKPVAKSNITVSFMGTQEAYEKAVESIKWLKDTAATVAKGIHDAIDVEAPLKRIGAPRTAFAQKNIYSKMAKEEEKGLHEVRQNAELFNFDNSVAPDVVLSAEDPKYFNQLPNETKSKIQSAVEHLRNYFKKSQKEYAKRGIHLDFKKRILNDLNNLIDEAEKHGIEKPEAARKLKELKDARDIAKRMSFVHIPSAMWFEDYMGKDPAGASKILKLLATQQRKSLSIKSLIDRDLIKKEDVHPGDIIASYARRKGRDFALLDFVEAARKEGLASLKKKSDMVQVPGYIAPVLAKYWVKKPLADIVYDMTRMGQMSKFEKVIAVTKMMQFYNPLFLPMYDVVQQGMLVGPRYYKMPKYWKEGIKDVWNKTPEYWTALGKGIASKPYPAPWDEFQESLEYAKKSNPEIAKTIAADVFSPRVLKTIYHGSWRIAWELDKTTRMVTNRYLLDQGFSPREAAQIAAKYHSDYASVPPATRRILNKVFFTPTFKLTMGKLFAKMVKESVRDIVKAGNINPTSKAYAKGLISTFAILEAYDLFMTKGLGFKRDEWARRYIKPGVDTPDGKKDLVVTWSSPANMFLKYIYRGQQAAKQGELTQRVRSFIEMNKWEFHPIWRTLYDEFWTNKTPTGDEIVNAFDPSKTKAIKRIKYFTKSMVAVVGLMDKDTMDASARKQFVKETSKAFEFLTRPFLFKYMRGTKNQRLRYQFQQTKKKFMHDLYNGKITPERFNTFRKEMDNIINQVGGK